MKLGRSVWFGTPVLVGKAKANTVAPFFGPLKKKGQTPKEDLLAEPHEGLGRF